MLLRCGNTLTCFVNGRSTWWTVGRAVIGRQRHLAQWFLGPDGKADDGYKTRVKRRFVQWVIDVALREHERGWLNYQEEIGLHHTPTKKTLPMKSKLRRLFRFVICLDSSLTFCRSGSSSRTPYRAK